jgi:hypothetical protein
MNRKAKSLQRWSELANPTLKFLGLYEEPRDSNVATASASLGAAGALAAGFLMREPLGRLSRSLLAESTALVEHLSIAELLSLAGLAAGGPPSMSIELSCPADRPLLLRGAASLGTSLGIRFRPSTAGAFGLRLLMGGYLGSRRPSRDPRGSVRRGAPGGNARQ